MGFCCGSRKVHFLDRHVFTSITFFSTGIGIDELLRGIDALDALRILAAIALLLQGLFASFIFIRNGIHGPRWKCRNTVFFLVGGITGLMIGILIYYPIALDLNRDELTRARNSTTSPIMVDATVEAFTGSPSLMPTEPSQVFSSKRKLQQAASKLWFLVPDLAFSLLVLVNTVYGISIKVESKRRTAAATSGIPSDEELVAYNTIGLQNELEILGDNR